MALWIRNGSLVVDGSGNPIDCSTCPCAPAGFECNGCCTDAVFPSVLTANFSSTDCADIDGKTCTVTTTTGGCNWTGELPSSEINECNGVGNSWFPGIRCSGGFWVSDIAGPGSGDFGTLQSVTCSPIDIEFSYSMSPTSCCNTPRSVTIHFTE